MGEIREETIPFLGIQDFLEKARNIQEIIFSYNENIDQIGIIQKKLLMGIGWAQEARRNLSIELDNTIKHNKALEKAVKKKLHDSYAHKFLAQREESIRQEKLASLTTLFMESVTKYKNLDIHFKAKSKTKIVNAIKITGVSFSEKEIEEKIDNWTVFCLAK